MPAVAVPLPPIRPPLYDLHAGPDGVIHFAPTCAEGHALGMAFIERMWEMDRLRDISPRQPAPAAVIAPSRPPVSDLRSPTKPQPTPPAAPAAGAKTLGELIELHLANLRHGPQRATSPLRDREPALRMLLETVGDQLIAHLTPADAIAFADLLGVWPKRKQNYPHLADLAAPEVAVRAKKAKLPPIGLGTQHKHLMHVNALMNWAVKLGEIPANPFRYVDTARYRKDENGRLRKKKDTFSKADLMAIFDPTHMRNHNAPHKYWVPLIGHLTGMRVNEITQLYLDDVVRKPYLDEEGDEHEVLVFNISPDGEGQSVKTSYSIRSIPVPKTLLDLGFERYIEEVRASGSTLLFPGIPWEEGGPGRSVSQWFNGIHLREVCGIKSPRKTLHCLRHNLTTLMERRKVPDSIICAINGHSPGEGVDKKTYVADATVLECREALESLPFPNLPLEPYVSGRFDRYLAHAATERERQERAIAEGTEFKRRMGPRPEDPVNRELHS